VVKQSEGQECDDMSGDDATNQLRRRQALSALVDGDGEQAEQACRAWRDDAAARADWHAYHLIGEAMRSEHLSCAPQHDALFLGRFHKRLAREPVVLAPEAPAQRAARRHRWAAPTAVAAGFVAVAGVLVVTRMATPDGALPDRAALVANSPVAPSGRGVQPVALAPVAEASAPGTLVVEGNLIRSAELDRYLAAHKQYGDTSPLSVPGGVLRSNAVAAPGR
jgi:sigma-E factor negative regulatory protein RseA